MLAEVPLFPEQASTYAVQVDHLFYFLSAITGAVAFAVTLTLLFFAWRYRRSRVGEQTPPIKGSVRLETAWTVTPFLIFITMFAWGAGVYNTLLHPPADAAETYVVAKQWMWKIQHEGGQREINELHVPLNRPIKVTLTSEDVIHDFFVPAFRTHVDVLPGRYVSTWFQPTKTGTFHLFCSQYCGTGHANMVGSVIVMEPADFEDWLEHHADGSLADKGRQLFLKLQCVTCHSANATAMAPVLEGLYQKPAILEQGGSVIADESYFRESILNPQSKIVRGWRPLMPSFKGQISEDEMVQLVAFLKSLGPGQTPVRTEDSPPPVATDAMKGKDTP